MACRWSSMSSILLSTERGTLSRAISSNRCKAASPIRQPNKLPKVVAHVGIVRSCHQLPLLCRSSDIPKAYSIRNHSGGAVVQNTANTPLISPGPLVAAQNQLMAASTYRPTKISPQLVIERSYDVFIGKPHEGGKTILIFVRTDTLLRKIPRFFAK